MKQGLLLINLGTPDAPDTSAIRHYLAEFLADARVLDLPAPLRYMLLYGVILPFRPKTTAKAYQSIWTDKGSPLLVNSLSLTQKLQEKLEGRVAVALGMRYGQPSIAKALESLADCTQLTVLPLYPQYSSAASGSSVAEVLRILSIKTTIPSLHIVKDFYQAPAFIKAQAKILRPYIVNHDYFLFSYHGLPERQLQKAGCETVCQSTCAAREDFCYRAQCQATTRALADELHLKPESYNMAFQSRLGKIPWIKPYMEDELHRLAEKGIKRLAVACPSFTADCLETLEETGIRARELWLQAGGEELTLIPCVNDNEEWVEGILEITNLNRFNP